MASSSKKDGSIGARHAIGEGVTARTQYVYHLRIDSLTDHSDLGSRDRRGSRDLNATDENAASKYCCFPHRQRSISLTLVPSYGPAVEREDGLGGQPVNEYHQPSPLSTHTEIPHSPRSDTRWIQEDFRAKFYKHYRKEAEEYDKDFMKKHEEDLNTTLIFVRLEGCNRGVMLTLRTGRSVLRRDINIHHPGPARAPTGPKRRNRCSPPRPDLQN